MSIVIKNNASNFLADGINDSQTTIDLQSAASFPALGAGEYFYGTIESVSGQIEIVKVTNIAGNTLTVVRAQEGTSAAAFAEGSRFELRVTVGSVEDYVKQNAELADYTPAGASAVTTNIQDKLRETFSAKDFGAVGDGVTDDTAAIQAAIDYASSFSDGITDVYFSGVFNIILIEPKSNVRLVGVGPFAKIVINNPTTGSATSGVTGLYAESKTITDFHLLNLVIDGNRIANGTNRFEAIVQFRDCTLTRFSAKNCIFYDPMEDFIRILNQSTNSISKDIEVSGCKFIGTKFNLAGIGPYPGNALRTFNIFNVASNYGTKTIFNVRFINNYCEKIRTGADIKRGVAGFIVSDNYTYDMMDCDHSVDGSFKGVISNNICSTSSGFDAVAFAGGTNTNYIEVQGEYIVIANNVCEQNGVGKTNGIFITDYGRPEEAGVGHVSIGITVENNNVNNVNVITYKFSNPHKSKINNNLALDSNVWSIAIDSGITRNDSLGNPLVSENVSITNNVCASSIITAGTKHSYGGNVDTNGQDPFRFPSGTLLNPVATLANMFVVSGYSELNTNTDLEISGAAPNNVIGFNNPEAATVASTIPYDTTNAITAVDTSTTNVRAVEYGRKLSAKQNDKFFVKVSAKQNSSTGGCSVIVQEFDSSDVVTTTAFYGLAVIPSDWTDYMCVHRVSEATTAYVLVKLVPATAFNNPTATGNTDFAKLKIGRTPQGLNY